MDALLFYAAYEQFYKMAKNSDAFRGYCSAAFGEDFSQDGFSDLHQVQKILQYIPKDENCHILDVGCGNGKMVKYLQKMSGAFVHGFDYSKNAIASAQADQNANADFRVGIIGEIEYSEKQFDLVTAMDTVYFAPDMVRFVEQVNRWLKPSGKFFIAYQEATL